MIVKVCLTLMVFGAVLWLTVPALWGWYSEQGDTQLVMGAGFMIVGGVGLALWAIWLS